MRMRPFRDRKSTRLNSSHTEIYTLSLHDALPICVLLIRRNLWILALVMSPMVVPLALIAAGNADAAFSRSEEHTSELQSHRDLHSFPTRRSSDLRLADP